MDNLAKTEIIRNIIKDVDEDLQDEEIIHLVLSKAISNKKEEPMTFGERSADKIARFAGSWSFVIGFIALLAMWIIVNIVLSSRAFDPFPFILMNLILSCIAAIQAPMIMMSQNRQESKDRKRAENDYLVNLKTEIIIQDLHIKLDQLLLNQELILNMRDKKDNSED
jgi:Predicted membrane protein